ncbi:MAG: menaquinone biosynthesis protein [Flavobacteriales bacterium]|nr:menaquinone biosynthesis protein [Flavobacteriales bacterium]
MKIKISIVSYSNTLPFLYGLMNSSIFSKIDLCNDIPSICAKKLLSNEVDIGLVPVAILPQLKNYHILTDYCIGAKQKVKSVLLVSKVPLNEITNVLLDYQSKTSINLVQILARKFWNINPNFSHAEPGYEDLVKGSTAAIIIGDRTFNLDGKFQYTYDLAEEWNKFSGLPFAFACWVSNKKIPDEFVSELNQALNFGVEHISESISLNESTQLTNEQMLNYLTNDISYHFTAEKRRALNLFLEFLSENVNI